MINDLQVLCEQGQQLLMETRYWEAERSLAEAERIAWEARDWDTLARLYMPLQEARRQRRQRCGEGSVVLDLLATSPADRIDPVEIVSRYPEGQLLIAGWGSIAPAVGVREIAQQKGLFVETFLGAVYPMGNRQMVAIVPTADVSLPGADQAWTIDELARRLPAHTILLSDAELPRGVRRGTSQTYAEVMSLWERLAAPFLAAADATTDAILRAGGYRKTLTVDYACELAHQKLSDLAKNLDRQARSSGSHIW